MTIMLVPLLAQVKSALRRVGLLPLAKRVLSPLIQSTTRRAPPGSLRYRVRAAIEQANYANVVEVHDLPPIFHYWSEKFLLPRCRALGFSSPDDLYLQHLEGALRESKVGRFLSIGSGNCDLEIRLAQQLREKQHTKFTIECLDLNSAMLQRANEAATLKGVADHILTVQGDFNTWTPQGLYDVVIANQALHHVTELEHLFDSIKLAIGEDGRFLSSDMIGRNGHQRWPEAKQHIDSFWKEIKPEMRYNHLLRRTEATFQDWDASISGFEGIRAQDILPLLVERFQFELFLSFGNLIDPFTDRAFGPNFDPERDEHRAFIDRVHQKDEAEIAAGRITPTHMIAVMRNSAPVKRTYSDGVEPSSRIRMVR